MRRCLQKVNMRKAFYTETVLRQWEACTDTDPKYDSLPSMNRWPPAAIVAVESGR